MGRSSSPGGGVLDSAAGQRPGLAAIPVEVPLTAERRAGSSGTRSRGGGPRRAEASADAGWHDAGLQSAPPRPHDEQAFADARRHLAEVSAGRQQRSWHLVQALTLGLRVCAVLVALGSTIFQVGQVAAWLTLAALCLCGAAVLADVAVRLSWRPLRLRATDERGDTLSLLTLAAGLTLVAQLTGAASSPVFALPLAVVVFAGAALSPRATLAVALVTAVLLGGLVQQVRGEPTWPQLLGVASTVLGFGALAALALRGAALRFRDLAFAESELRWQRLLEDARTYRLTADGAAQDGPVKRTLAATQTVREGVSHVVELCYRALRAHTAVLLYLDEAGEALRVHDLRSDSDQIAVGQPLAAGRGALGSVVTTRAAVRLHSLGDRFEGITYYAPPLYPQCFMAVPLLEGEHLRGVLAVDRLEDEPFTPADEALLSALGRELLRAAEAERLFAMMDHDRRGQEALLRLTEKLNSALSLDAALDALVDGLHGISQSDLAAVVLATEDGALEVVRARGEMLPAQLEGTALGDAGSLVHSAVRTQAALPARAELNERSRLFGDVAPMAGLVRGKVVPLVHQGACLGAMVVASRRRGGLDEDVLRLVQVAAGHGAIALVNGRLYASMERMATRDGLTGLLNHRTFQEQLEQALARGLRFGSPVTLMLCDIDHFKQVNDLHGHPAGDAVLRAVAEALAGQARRTDIVARYGGEEFAVVMEATDADGALAVAERIRQAVAAVAVQGERGVLRVTLSAGLATHPEDAVDRAELIQRADAALYQAKHAGRDRCVHHRRSSPR